MSDSVVHGGASKKARLSISGVDIGNFIVDNQLAVSMFRADSRTLGISFPSHYSIGMKEEQRCTLEGNSLVQASSSKLVDRETTEIRERKLRCCDDASSMNDINPELADPRSPLQVPQRVKLIIQKWGAVSPIPPDKFLMRLLGSRGYATDMIPAMSSEFRRLPSQAQIDDYAQDLVNAVRQSDLQKLQVLKKSGRSMTACNRFGESIVHMACRRSEFDVVDYILSNGGDEWLVDDFGRTPLHDACWRPEPRFDVVTLILDRNLTLLRVQDVRGSNPLNYVREEHWLHWCAYFFHQKDKYWAILES